MNGKAGWRRRGGMAGAPRRFTGMASFRRFTGMASFRRFTAMLSVLAVAGCVSNPDNEWGVGKSRLVDQAKAAQAQAKAEAAKAGPAPAAAVAADGGKGGVVVGGEVKTQAAPPPPPPPPPPEDPVDRALRLAAQARRSGDTLTAASLYRQVLANRAKDLEAQLGLGHVLLDDEDKDGARLVVTELITRMPQNDRVLALAARYDISVGDLASAAARLALGASIYPDSRDIVLTQAVFEDMRGNHASARQLYGQILAFAPDDVVAGNNLALSLLADNDAAQAATILEGLVGDGTKAAPAFRHNLAMAYGLLGRDDDSRRLLAMDLADSAIDSNLKYYSWLRQRRLPVTTPGSTRPAGGELRLPPMVPTGR